LQAEQAEKMQQSMQAAQELQQQLSAEQEEKRQKSLKAARELMQELLLREREDAKVQAEAEAKWKLEEAARPPEMKPPAGQPPGMKPPPGQPPDMVPPPGELPAMMPPGSMTPGLLPSSGLKRGADEDIERDAKRQNTGPTADGESSGENQVMISMAVELQRLQEENNRLKLATPATGLPLVTADASAGMPQTFGALGSRPGNGMTPVERPMPSVRAVMPAVFSLPASAKGSGKGQGQVFSVLGDVLAEVLDGEIGERFLRLLDQRLGPQVAAQMAEMRRSTPGSSEVHALEPLWQLTRHHVPGHTDDS